MTFFDLPPTEAPRPDLFVGTELSDWEDWESESVVTPIEDDEQLIGTESQEDEEVEIQLDFDLPSITATPFPTPVLPQRPMMKKSVARKSAHSTTLKPKRLKSRQRQKAQNAKAGIKLVTDLSIFRKPHGNQARGSPSRPNYKFVDAAALKALEGSPNSASVGNWNWLKRQKSAASSHLTVPTPTNQGLSPADAPIVIGISMEPEQAREISPNTAVIASAVEFPAKNTPHRPRLAPPTQPLTPAQQRSVWSPDTPNTATTMDETSPQSAHSISSIYSMYARRRTGGPFDTNPVPPVPAVPSNYKSTAQRLIHVGSEEDLDSGTPCTLFEEDGTTSPRKSLKIAGAPKGLDTVAEGSNDVRAAVANPAPAKQPTGDSFRERQARLQKQAPALIDVSPVSPASPENEWWKDVNEKRESPRKQRSPSPISIPSARSSPMPRALPIPVMRTASPSLSPARTPSPFRNPATQRGPSPNRNHTPSPKLPLGSATMASHSPLHTPTRVESAADKARILVEESRTPSRTPTPSEEPPPYSLAQQKTGLTPPVRYRPHFPPGHPMRAHFPPSPGPISPAMNRTMTSQGAISMTEIPLTPAPLPERQAGTYLPPEHFAAASGSHNRVERERRRHEKEEVVARKLGGFWKGRGCIPASGCYGRPGREGRKKRRICFGVIVASVLLLILTIVLAVTLTKKKHAVLAEEQSIFVNLTNFPPMPTGVLTVVGPNIQRQFDGCTAPATLWSCHLPKEQQESVVPFNSDQPTVIMQIQFDNSTDKTWDVPNGTPPRPTPTKPKVDHKQEDSGEDERTGGPINNSEESDTGDSSESVDPTDRRAARSGSSSLRARQQRFAAGISPQPAPPSFEEMFFLGNTTDGIISDDKAGEPTPFYVSLLTSTEQSAGPNLISDSSSPSNRAHRRQVGLPEPPPPELTSDGTGAPARLLPTQVTQQPIRLYDRGLPSEHYGFYTYFSRTLYIRSVTVLNDTDAQDDVPLDQDGGARETEAKFLVTWTSTRFFVKMFTNSGTSKKLLNKGSVGDDTNINRPGTMPYPITFGLDTHGGDETKLVWAYPIDERQHIDTSKARLLANNMSNGGSQVNPRQDENKSFGGVDGGSGGCACEWQNFLETFGGD